MTKLLFATLTVILCSCTLSVTTIHTQGSASDVVDENQRADPTVSPNLNLSVPAGAL